MSEFKGPWFCLPTDAGDGYFIDNNDGMLVAAHVNAGYEKLVTLAPEMAELLRLIEEEHDNPDDERPYMSYADDITALLKRARGEA